MLSKALLTEQHGPAERETAHPGNPHAAFMEAGLRSPLGVAVFVVAGLFISAHTRPYGPLTSPVMALRLL